MNYKIKIIKNLICKHKHAIFNDHYDLVIASVLLFFNFPCKVKELSPKSLSLSSLDAYPAPLEGLYILSSTDSLMVCLK